MSSKYLDARKSAHTGRTTALSGEARKFEFPSNVRQIGGLNKGIRIYIEDYAYTYINKLGAKLVKEDAAVFLTGFQVVEKGEQILVITGVIKPPQISPPASGLVFSESDWRYARETIEKYFRNFEIIGWARLQPGYGLYLSASDISGHYQEFSDKTSVLFLYDPEEKQSCFFTWNEKQDDLNEAAGYFVYYDKNQEMNAYIAETGKRGVKSFFHKPQNDEDAEETEEPYVSDITDDVEAEELSVEDERESISARLPRTVENAKRLAEIQRQKRIISMMTSVSVLLFFSCVIMGIGLLQNGERISLMETQLRDLRTGYNNIVTKLNDSVFPAFAAQTPASVTEQTTESNAAAETAAEVAKTEEKEASSELSLDDALGITPAETAKEPEAEPVKYVVQRGDTLTYISNRFYGVPNNFAKIMEVNGITNADALVEGMTLIIP